MTTADAIWEAAARAKGWTWSPAHDAYVHDDFSDRPPTWEDCCDLSDLNTLDEAREFLAPREEAGASAPADGEDSPEDRFEHFIRQAIDSSPEPLKRLGEYLTQVLDEDQWPTAERYLLGATLQVQGEPVGAWRPIETAPRDGAHFLAYEESGDVFRAAFDKMGVLYAFCGQPVVQSPEPILWRPWADLAPPSPAAEGGR